MDTTRFDRDRNLGSGVSVRTYCDEGGCEIQHFSSLLSPTYPRLSAALIRLSGRYPAAGLLARNCQRRETIVVLTGQICVVKNGFPNHLKPSMSLQINPGETYFGKGKGTAVIIVCDLQVSGQTELISLQDEKKAGQDTEVPARLSKEALFAEDFTSISSPLEVYS